MGQTCCNSCIYNDYLTYACIYSVGGDRDMYGPQTT